MSLIWRSVLYKDNRSQTPSERETDGRIACACLHMGDDSGAPGFDAYTPILSEGAWDTDVRLLFRLGDTFLDRAVSDQRWTL